MAAVVVIQGCDGSSEDAATVSQLEAQQQIKRLREDTEIELKDLRGRWLATEGLLTRQREILKSLKAQLSTGSQNSNAKLAEFELSIGALSAEVERLRRSAGLPTTEEDEERRLARSYEEIYCLRKRGAEESVGSVYKRYGFADAAAWSSAWQRVSRNETFEREVSERVRRLCP